MSAGARCAAMATVVAILGFLTAVAQAEQAHCGRGHGIGARGALSLGTAASPERRVHFVLDSSKPGCPGEAQACRAGAYVLPGDLLLIGKTLGTFVCVAYLNDEGTTYVGWLWKENVSLVPPKPIASLDDWEGIWIAPEKQLEIRRAPGNDALLIKGRATWGAGDPERVRIGAVHVGDVDVEARPSGDSMAFTVSDGRAAPYDARAVDCSLRLRVVGERLVAIDNGLCGGQNVSFSGLYHRKR